MNQYHIHVRGLVQGVGFRPYVYRLANEMGLRGYVDNSNDGVLIVLQSTCIQKEKFLKALIKSSRPFGRGSPHHKRKRTGT